MSSEGELKEICVKSVSLTLAMLQCNETHHPSILCRLIKMIQD